MVSLGGGRGGGGGSTPSVLLTGNNSGFSRQRCHRLKALAYLTDGRQEQGTPHTETNMVIL